MGYELLIWAKRGELHGTAFVTLWSYNHHIFILIAGYTFTGKTYWLKGDQVVYFSIIIIHTYGKEQTNENSWEFHLTDKIAQLSKMTLEMHTEFWLSTLQTWFHGYQTPEEYKATIWGREVDLCISIAPLETPTEKLPIIEEKSEKVRMSCFPRNSKPT